jgi:hypothetical protein
LCFKEYVPYAHGGYKVPATIWFRYDLNPITVKYTEKRKPFYTFLTTVNFSLLFTKQKLFLNKATSFFKKKISKKVCAIVGGTFTVVGIIDSLIFTASETFKKLQVGKLG